MAKAATKSKGGKTANAKVAGGAKSAKKSGSLDAVVVEALERAAKSVSAGIGLGKEDRSAPGTYALKLKVEITGDIERAADVKVGGAPGKLVPSFSDFDLGAALLVLVDPTQREETLRKAVESMKAARNQERPESDAFLLCGELIRKQSMPLAKEFRLTAVEGGSAATTKAGSLTGKPGVKVSGTISGRTVEVKVAA